MPVNLPLLETFHSVPGIKIGTHNVGIKQTERPDLVVFELDEGATTAGIFTTNAFCAAPVQICQKHIKQADTRYLIINTGNANAGTGQEGFADAMSICEKLAEIKGVPVESILPFSTGVIGERLPLAKITGQIEHACNDLAEGNWFEGSRGIMTTDTQPKGYTAQFEFQGETITVSGMSKGAGMIMPNMATMLCYIATDAPVSKEVLQSLCTELGDKSFNRVTVDGDTSTNDSCILMASGKANIEPITKAEGESYQTLRTELQKAFLYLAQAIVRDGEGANKFVAIDVQDCENSKEALRIAYTVAHSPLVKTALFASDANWGRILAAVGRSGVKDMDLNAIQIYLDDVCIVENGARAASYTEEAGTKVMEQDELTIRIIMGRGEANETVWTTDLSHEYVTINAEYRT